MSPRKAWEFLTSKFGLFLVFLAVLFVGLWIFGNRQGKAKQAERLAHAKQEVEVGQVKIPLTEGLEDRLPQQVNATASESAASTDGRLVPFRPATNPPPATVAPPPPPKLSQEKNQSPPPPPRKIHHRSLLVSYSPPPEAPATPAQAPEAFMPFGTLLKCKLVNTVDSANIETPVIAILLEDVWQNGELVIPANTLVHGTARAGRIRDRINAAGTWRFVWQDGRELVFSGIALDREYEHDIDGYGITDGSAGMKGRLMAADNLQELKMLAAAALSGFARGTQDRTQTAFGTTITGSVSNGVREGVGDVFDLYAQRTLRDLEENGYFVRVPAGKEFYVYVIQSVNPEDATIAGVSTDRAAPADTEAAAVTSASSASEPPMEREG